MPNYQILITHLIRSLFIYLSLIVRIPDVNAQNDYLVYFDEANPLNEKISGINTTHSGTTNGTVEYSIKTDTSTLNTSKTSGTGFALSGNGLIVTSYHVIAEGTSISVKGINGDFLRSYKAKVVLSDLENDLAIIKIEDASFNSIVNIPYSIKSLNSDVGENIFVLGFPLRATMGEEIKLTNGIISSGTGFQGDTRAYQISAAIQPGNSGGPLFNNSGCLIGVIKSKHLGAENVAYAIKAGYLKKLIGLLPVAPILNNKNNLGHLSLAKQVKILNNYVYVIEME